MASPACAAPSDQKMMTKTSLMHLFVAVGGAAALCHSADAFSAATFQSCTKPKPPRTRLFQGTISGATSFPLISPEELEADILINSSSSDSSSDLTTTIIPQQQENNTAAIIPTTNATTTEGEELLVPSTWSQALHRFFLGDIGPPLVVLTISGFIFTRCQLLSTTPLSITELSIFASSIVLWWGQEYFFHRILLHSPFHWIGKSIHRAHHDKDYFHISIDPPALLLGWLFAAHFIIKALIPQWHLCLAATIGYSLAGLVYEWSHYIVHTKVKPRIITSTTTTTSSSLYNKQQRQSPPPSPQRMIILPLLMRGYAKMRDNHIRHHLVDSRYWYAFSVTEMDDLFHTNPDVKELQKMKKKEMMESREGFQ